MSVSTSSRRLALNSVAALAISAAAVPARADLHFPEPVANVGVVYAGASLVHDFTFENQGPENVVILDARASCGCAQPQLPHGPFRPAEKGTITLEVNTLSQPPGPHAWI